MALRKSHRHGTSQADCYLQSSHAPLEDLDENSRNVVTVRRERLSLLRGKGSVAFDELHHDICSLQTH